MFDRTNAAHLAAAKARAISDSIDFAAGTQDILEHFNDPANNPSALTTLDSISAQQLWIVLSRNGGVSASERDRMQWLFEMTTGLDDDLSWARPDVAALSGQVATALSQLTRPISIFEEMFAVDATVRGETIAGQLEKLTMTDKDWFAVRDS